MTKRRVIIAAVLLISSMSLYGCKDKMELEEQGYVSTIGMDKGKNNNLSITFQLINAKYGGGPGKASGTGEKAENVTFDAPDLVSARDLANVSVARRITLSHAKVLVIGEELARDDKFFQILEATLRDRELRRGIDLIISREKASSFVKDNDPKLEDRINKFYDFMSRRWEETGFVPLSDVNKFMQRTEEDTSLFLAVYGTTRKYEPKTSGGYEADYLPGQVDMKGTNPTELIGAAVFKAGKMIGKLTGEENRLTALLRPKSDVRSMIYTFPDPKDKNFRVTTRLIKDKKTKIKIDTKGKTPKVDVTVPIKVEVLAIPSFNNYVEDLKNEKVLKDFISSYLEERSISLVKKTQEVFKGEPFQWELELRKNFPTYDEYKAYGWLKKYPGAEVNIKYAIKIKGYGKQLAPPEMPQRGDEITE